MKRRRTDATIRIKSKIPYFEIRKSCRNYYLSLYVIKGNNLVCTGTSQTYYTKKRDTKDAKKKLVSDFISKYKPNLDQRYSLKLGSYKITKRYFGYLLINTLKEKGLTFYD